MKLKEFKELIYTHLDGFEDYAKDEEMGEHHLHPDDWMEQFEIYIESQLTKE